MNSSLSGVRCHIRGQGVLSDLKPARDMYLLRRSRPIAKNSTCENYYSMLIAETVWPFTFINKWQK